jgi:uncharacterized protein YlxW (UPF0749 family)
MTGTPTTQPDASLSLLQRLVEDAMDPGYREATEHTDPTRLGWGSTMTVSLVLFVLGLLVVAAVLQVRGGAPSNAETRAQLLQRVEAATADVDSSAAAVDSMTRQVTEAREQSLSGSTRDRALAAEVSALEDDVGGAAVSGPGVRLTMADGPPAPAGEGGPDLARVLDTDVQLAVNGLFASGATAIAVNDQRVTVLSPIRSAGEAVLVDFRPLTPPYVIEAVGPRSLESTFEKSRARQELAGLEAAYGIDVDLTASDDVTVPARPDLQVRYAQERRSGSRLDGQEETP